jgi:hypothetical protein
MMLLCLDKKIVWKDIWMYINYQINLTGEQKL